MRFKGFSTAALSIIVFSMVLTGCGKKAKPAYTITEATTQDAEEVAANNEETEVASSSIESDQEQVTAASSYDSSRGPIIPEVRWISNSIEYSCDLYQYDINDGSKSLVFSFSNKKGFDTSVTPNGNLEIKSNTGNQWYTLGLGWRYGQVFSPDFSKAAVEYRDGANGEHVGWVDAEGNYTDISDKIHPYTDDFTSVAPKDSGAIFAPWGDFVFMDKNNNKIIFVNPDNLEVINEAEATGYEPFYSAEGVSILINSRDNESSPLNSFLDYYVGKDSNEVFGILNSNAYLSYGSICKIDLTEQGQTTFIPITPDSDYTIDQCAYYNGKLAFIAHRGESYALFVMDDVYDQTTVRKVCDIPLFQDNAYPQMHTYGAMFWR